MASAGMREFKIGQYVYYRPRNRVRAEGRYVVMRLLPQANDEVRYRIRSEDTPSREYTAEARELRSVPGPLAPAPAALTQSNKKANHFLTCGSVRIIR
jgi:hypothetical protein